MSKFKNKNQLKTMTLDGLILVPTIIGIAQHGVEELISHNILEKVKGKVVKIVDTDIKRLDKVKNRITESNEGNKIDTILKLDNMIVYLKENINKISQSNNISTLKKISRDIQKKVYQNNVNIGHVFDNRKDAKKEKEYNKLEKKFEKYEQNIKKNSLHVKVKDNVVKLINKGRNIIEQMRNEDKHDKDRLETKILRRELANILNTLNRYNY